MSIFDHDKMRAIRERLGLTQQQAAERAGFKTRQAWNAYECGRQVPSLDTLAAIARALKVSPGDLLTE